MGLREALAIAAVCCAAAGWLLNRRKPLASPKVEVEQACPEPMPPAAAQTSARARFTVFISHAGAQKNFALWVRSHVRVGGYQAFVDECDLQCALHSTIPHLRSRSMLCFAWPRQNLA